MKGIILTMDILRKRDILIYLLWIGVVYVNQMGSP